MESLQINFDMKQKPSLQDLTRQEYRNFITKGALTAVSVFLFLAINIVVEAYPAETKRRLFIIVLGGPLYIALFSLYLARLRNQRTLVIWINVFISSVGLLLLAFYLPAEINIYYRVIAVLTIIFFSTLYDRITVITVFCFGIVIPSVYWLIQVNSFAAMFSPLSLPLLAVFISETLLRVQEVARQHIHRLETINEFSRQVASTLDQKEIFDLLSAAIPRAVTADTFYVGIEESDEIFIPLFHDEGEYFNEMRVKREGTLSGWVVRHERELFLPDLRDPIDLPDVNVVVAGKEKTSLSWIGVPMITKHFKGLIALASYQPNAFNRGDIELLANLSQHVAMALENAIVHQEVDRKSRIDQMTGVLNHGAFLETLQKMADDAKTENTLLSLIMLDVDLFKKYNDTYGHLVGDRVLNALCETIRHHIKSTDAIGRWGGEEFIIALPNAGGDQAFHVAERIRKTMNEMEIPGRVGEPIPAPTVSQGVAIFPSERDAIFDLIDLADQRLYVAKGRGRNQIEPEEIFWEANR